MDERFPIAFHHFGTPEEIEACERKEHRSHADPSDHGHAEGEGFHYGSYVASVRVEWDEPADEVRHGAALRRHIAEINSEAR